ncbi:hypothetical protein [Nostoc sp.]|uniref:hypothetical protein n=1 Tax=Nostoc sp. TaxID=1180 RepID=UPI002FFC9BCF
MRCLSEINSTVQSYSTSSSASQLPPTKLEKPKQSRQLKTSATTQIQYSKNETNIFSSQIAQFTGGVIAFAILFLIKFGSRGIYKPLQSHPSQPVVTSTPTELQANNSEPANTDSTQQPSISNENIPSGVPSGWKKFEGGGAELWLPASWESGDFHDKLYKSMKRSGSHNPEIEQFAQQVQQNPLAFLLAFDSNKGDSGFLTNVIVSNEQVTLTINLETYLQEESKHLPAQIRIVDMKTGLVEGYQVGRIITEISPGKGRSEKQISYLMKDGRTIWSVIFSTGADKFEQQSPIFEASFRSFSVK